MAVVRVLLLVQRLVLGLREPQARQPEQPPPVPLQQEQQRVLPPAQVLRQRRARQRALGAVPSGWGLALRSACWQANFSKGWIWVFKV
ncbi:MAG: hypothetical protein E7K92_11935 [Serratia marcescens]|nr:hypothetical protein [Serratia marcescens]